MWRVEGTSTQAGGSVKNGSNITCSLVMVKDGEKAQHEKTQHEELVEQRAMVVSGGDEHGEHVGEDGVGIGRVDVEHEQHEERRRRRESRRHVTRQVRQVRQVRQRVV